MCIRDRSITGLTKFCLVAKEDATFATPLMARFPVIVALPVIVCAPEDEIAYLVALPVLSVMSKLPLLVDLISYLFPFVAVLSNSILTLFNPLITLIAVSSFATF